MNEPQAREHSDMREEEFIESLERLDAGGRARLKRNAGLTLAEARDVLGIFYRLLPPAVPHVQHDDYFLVATIYPLAEGSGRHRDLGATLRAARSDTNAKGIDRRVEVLLGADGDQLPFHLRQAIRFAQSNRVTVNWPHLLRDVLRWNHPTRFVQQRWAESYFAVAPTKQREDGRVRATVASAGQ